MRSIALPFVVGTGVAFAIFRENQWGGSVAEPAPELRQLRREGVPSRCTVVIGICALPVDNETIRAQPEPSLRRRAYFAPAVAHCDSSALRPIPQLFSCATVEATGTAPVSDEIPAM